MTYPYVLTGSSIVVTVDGQTINIQDTAPNYQPLKKALLDKDWEAVKQALTVEGSIAAWSKGFFKFEGEKITYKGEEVPQTLAKRMSTMAAKGENPEALMKFWEKLQKNPSWRSVEQLFPFLDHQGIPIQPNGNFLAYKGVKENYTDAHTGTVDNKPGVVNEMPRNKISDDPKTPCHYGYHVGALGYARSFSAVTVVCEVDPADVVCIPYDESQQKMRVCKYKVVGNHNGELLPSTTYELESDKTDVAEFEIEAEDLEEAQEVSPELANVIDKVTTVVVKEKKLKTARPDEKRPKLIVPAKFKNIHTMGQTDLMQESLDTLRTYATKVLHMVGASKILGGKIMLVKQILKVRKNFK